MTTDISTLRQTLHQTDNTAPTIQSSSRSLMTYYDKPNGATLAVSEWRNVLQTCRKDQLLPLLYVANEVLQTSKRNRGNRFLEAFSPVLGSSLIYICQRLVAVDDNASSGGDAAAVNGKEMVEKVRRTVKIWGDRRIFSMRFVMDILGGLEKYRNGMPVGSGAGSAGGMTSGGSDGGYIRQNSGSHSTGGGASAHKPSILKRSSLTNNNQSSNDRSSDDDNNSGSDDDDDLFGGNGSKLLDVDVSIDSAALNAAAAASSSFGAGAKRRRSSNLPIGMTGASSNAVNASSNDHLSSSSNNGNSNTNNNNNSNHARRDSASKKVPPLSTQSLLNLFQSLQNLDDKFNSSMGILSSIPSTYLDPTNADIDDLVGDDLTEMYKKVSEVQKSIKRERKSMYSVAVARKELEGDVSKRFVGWLKDLIKVDEEEIEFCEKLEKKLDVLAVFHAEAKQLREKNRDKAARQAAEAEALARQLAEEDERKRLLDDVLKKEGEAKPGMVWNPQLREYQYLHDPTQETWRD